MPYKKKAKRRTPRKTKALAVRPRRTVFHKPFPDTRNVTFKYTMYDNLSAAIAATSSQVMAINNCYDPDVSGVGAQPRYFDQLINNLLYEKFKVLSVGYRVEFVNKSTTSDAIVSWQMRDAVSSPLTPGALWDSKELGYTTVKTLAPLGQSNSRTVIKGRIECHRIAGISKKAYFTDPQFAGTYAAGPTTRIYGSAVASDNPQDAQTCDVDVYVTLYFHTRIFDLAHNVTQS